MTFSQLPFLARKKDAASAFSEECVTDSLFTSQVSVESTTLALLPRGSNIDMLISDTYFLTRLKDYEEFVCFHVPTKYLSNSVRIICKSRDTYQNKHECP
jgi:hypothetical protein